MITCSRDRRVNEQPLSGCDRHLPFHRVALVRRYHHPDRCQDAKQHHVPYGHQGAKRRHVVKAHGQLDSCADSV